MTESTPQGREQGAGERARELVAMKDYMSFWIDQPNLGKWVSSLIIRGRRICLNGIGLSIVVEDGKVSIDPVLPCMGPALRLLKKHPKLTSITFDRKKKKWEPTRYD